MNIKRQFVTFPLQILKRNPAPAWVSRKELEQLLNDKQANGLTIYYGCHRESTNSDRQKDDKGLHNVVLVATKDEVNPENPTVENIQNQLQDEKLKPQEANTSIKNYADAAQICCRFS